MPLPPYDWDTEKAEANLAKHGVPFEDVYGFQWTTAIQQDDTRQDYGERRVMALGKIGDRDHILVYTLRAGRVRVISLRKANKREAR